MPADGPEGLEDVLCLQYTRVTSWLKYLLTVGSSTMGCVHQVALHIFQIQHFLTRSCDVW